MIDISKNNSNPKTEDENKAVLRDLKVSGYANRIYEHKKDKYTESSQKNIAVQYEDPLNSDLISNSGKSNFSKNRSANSADADVTPQSASAEQKKKAAFIKAKLQNDVAAGRTASSDDEQEKSDDNKQSQSKKHSNLQTADTKENGSAENANFIHGNANRISVNEYKSSLDNEKVRQAYKSAILEKRYDRRKAIEAHSQAQINAALISAEISKTAAAANADAEYFMRDNIVAGAEMAGNYISAMQNGDAAAMITQPAVSVIQNNLGTVGKKTVKAIEKVQIAATTIQAADSVGGAAAGAATALAADSLKNKISEMLFKPSNKKIEDRLQKKFRHIDDKTQKKLQKIAKEKSEAMNGNISDKLEKKLDKIERNYEKQQKKLQKQQQQLQRQQQKNIYIQHNRSNPAFIGSKSNKNGYQKKKKGGLLALIGGGSIIPIIFLLLIVIMIIASLFSWITSFNYNLAGDEDNYNADEEADILMGYTLMVQNFMDITQAYYYYDYGDWSGGKYDYPVPMIDFAEYFEPIAQQVRDDITAQFQPLFAQVTSAEEGAALGRQLAEAITKALIKAEEEARISYEKLLYDLDHAMTPSESRQHWEVKIIDSDNAIEDSLDFTGEPIVGTNKFGNIEINTEFSSEELVAMVALYKMLRTFDTTNGEESDVESYELTPQDIMDFFYDTEFFNITAKISQNNSCGGNCTRVLTRKLQGKTYTYQWKYFCTKDHLNLNGKIGDCKTKDELIDKIIELTNAEDNGFDKKNTEELYEAYIEQIEKTLNSEETGLHRFGAADNSRANKFYEMLIKENDDEEKIPNNYWGVRTPFTMEYTQGSEDKS